MKVLSAEFVTSAALRSADRLNAGPGSAGRRDVQGPAAIDGIPHDGLAQIAFAGRSNVGKSSLLNALCRRKIARTSAAPGKTRLANVYRVTLAGAGAGPHALYLVDLPGYGYARGGASAATELAAIAEAYLAPGERRHAGSEALHGERPDSAGAGETGRRTGRASAVPDAVLLLVDSRHPGLESDVSAHRWLTAAGGEPQIVATKIDKLSRSERARNLKSLANIFGTAALPVSAQSGEGLNELWQLIIRLAKNR